MVALSTGSLRSEVVLRRGLDAFAELGYEQTSVRVLARRIGVSHNFINDRYGSKMAFWRAVVDTACAGLRPLVRPDDEAVDDAVALARIIVRYYVNVAGSPALHRLLVDEFSRESERLDHLFENYLGPNAQIMDPILSRLTAAGRIAPLPLHLLAFAIIGPSAAMVQAPLARRVGRPDPVDPGERERLAVVLARQVIGGIIPGFDRWAAAGAGT